MIEPVLQAFVVDVPDRTITCTRVEERVRCGRCVVPANLTLDVFLSCINDPTINVDGFFFELLIE